jgi:uncharacterized coiled-coil protein SlyX
MEHIPAQARPAIIIRGFKQTYGKDGKPVDWVEFSPAHDPQGTATWERVVKLIPPESMSEDRDPAGTKLAYMKHRWAMIEPAYKAWKDGHEIPLSGTALGSWPALTPEQADVFRSRGVKTVEAVRDMTDAQMGKIMLPNIRQLRETARAFLDGKAGNDLAEALAERDRQVKDMQAQLAELTARLNVDQDEAGDGEVSAPRRGRPPKDRAAA